MKRLLIMMGIILIGVTITACDDSSEERVAPTFSSVMIEDTNPVENGELTTYYMEKKADLGVKIELVNSSNFTITAIVINGIHYGATRFTEQSTNSVIYFALDTGTTLEDTVYSIDEIDYLDGNNSKTVFVDSNNEFKVYVYKVLPVVERENYLLYRDSISIDFNVTDVDSVIEDGSLIAQLYLGETKIQEQELSIGLTNILFTGLLADLQYDVKVVANYDLDDSNGLNSNIVLYSGPFNTLGNALPSAVISNFEVSSNSISFDVEYNDEDLVTVPGGLSVIVYLGDTIVRESLITGTVANISFDDLLNDTEYVLKVISNYDLRDGHGIFTDKELAEVGFKTLPKMVPTPTIVNLNIEENRVLFDIEIDDPTNIIDKSTLIAKLYVDGEFVKQASILEYRVDFEIYDFLSNYDFVIEIEASYDLNDGVGIQENKVIFSEIFTTLDNAIPSVNIESILVTQGYVTVDLQVHDGNKTLISSLKAILYENDVAVKTIQFGVEDTQIILGYLVKNSEVYSLDIVADYNLRDGLGPIDDHLLKRSLLISGQPKAPAAEFLNIVATNNSIILDIDFMDIDEIADLDTILVYLYLDGVEIAVESLDIGINTTVFLGLLSYNDYEIVVTVDYDIDGLPNGESMQYDQVLTVGNILTLEKEVPTVEIGTLISDTETISLVVSVIDIDTTILAGTTKAILYLDDVPTGDEIDLIVGANTIIFNTLLSDHEYEIKIITDYNLIDGNGDILGYDFESVSVSANTARKNIPSGRIENTSSDKENIWMNIYITDDDNVITGNLKAILYYNDGTVTGYEIPLVVGPNLLVTFLSIYSDTGFYITIVSDYYLNDESPIVLGEEMRHVSIDTENKEMITAIIDEDSVVLGTVSIVFDVEVFDPDDVVAGNLKAVLFRDGLATGDEEALVVGDNTDVTFTGLLSDSYYEVKIVTDFDLNTAAGVETEFISDPYGARTEYMGTPRAVVSNSTQTRDTISLDITIIDSDSTITSNIIAALYKDDVATGAEVILSIGLNENITFDTLLSNNEYVVKIITDYNLNDVNGNQADQILETTAITTNAYVIPVTTVSNLTITEDEVQFDFNYDDVDSVLVGGSVKASLWIDDVKVSEKLVFTENVSFDISNMVSDFDFVIRITGDFDLLDGIGIVDDGTIVDLELSTIEYDVPLADISDVTVNQNDVAVSVNITDSDEVITGNLKAILYDKDDVVLEEIVLTVGDNDISFAQLLVYSEMYSIVIVADYNLLDGNGVNSGAILQEYFVTVVNKLAPQPIISNIVLTTTSITFDVHVYDRDNTYLNNLTAVLYQDGLATGDTIALVLGANAGKSFTGLDSNSDYTVLIIADYNIDDGNGNRLAEDIGYTTQHTVAKVAPTATTANIVVDFDSITFDVNVIDGDSTINGNLKAVLYKDGVFVSETALVTGANNGESFTGLVSSSEYTIEIVTDYNLNDNTATVTDHLLKNTTQTTDTKVAPTATIANEAVDFDSITFDATIVDTDSVIEAATSKAVLYLDGVSQAEIALVTGANAGKSFTGLLSSETYVIKIVTNYDLDAGAGIVVASELATTTQTTNTKAEPTATITNQTVDYNSITFNATIVDTDSVIEAVTSKAVLYLDGVFVAETPLVTGANVGESFTGLLSSEEYVIKVVTNYDLDDGAGIVVASELASTTQTTDTKVVPTATISNKTILNTEITFDVNIVDDTYSITANRKAVLYKDGVATGAEHVLITGDNLGLSFDGLDFGEDYVIKVVTDYNLNTGGATVVAHEMVTNNSTTYQIIVVSEVDEQKTKVIFELSTDDMFSILTSDAIELQLFDKDDNPIGDTITINQDSGVLLLELYSDNDYYIEFSPTYDIGAGDVTEVVFTYNFHTLPLDIPVITIEMDTIVVANTTIDLDVEVGADGDSLITGTLKAYIYANGDDTTVIQEIALSPGTNSIQFTGLDTTVNNYQILIRADVDFNDGEGTVTLYVFDEASFIEGN